MKKITLTLVLLLLLALPTLAQTQFRAYLVRSGPYNPYTKEFDTEEIESNILITMENSVVKVRDNAHSVYITRNPTLDRDNTEMRAVRWEAIDEKGRDLYLSIIEHRNTGRWSMVLIYNDYMLQYFIEEIE
jgi:hypothetical protein